jgi:hypothetical protein
MYLEVHRNFEYGNTSMVNLVPMERSRRSIAGRQGLIFCCIYAETSSALGLLG